MATILLVKNDREEAAELSQVLQEVGHTVLIERSARAALTCLETEAVDAVVCDEVLPGMLSTDLVMAARQNLGRPGLPAVITSSVGSRLWGALALPPHLVLLQAPAHPDQVAQALNRFRFAWPGRDRRRAHDPSSPYKRRWQDRAGAGD